jgi:hypothetical protein
MSDSKYIELSNIKQASTDDIFGSRGSEGTDVGLLGCNQIPKFRRNILLPSSGLKMEAVCSSEILVSTYESTRRYNPAKQHRHLHRRENLRSHKHG